MSVSVDASSNTWMILMLARWLKLRSHMMTTQLLSWSDGFTLWSQKSSAHTERAELRKKTFAK